MEGTFRFELSPSKLDWRPFDSKDMLSRLNIAVTHPDHAIWWQEIPFQSTADVEIQLEMPEIISGKVMNEAGEPIQNAEAQIQSVSRGDPILGDPGNSLTHDALPQPVKTDTNGEFVILGLPQGATISLDVQGPGYAKERRHSVPVSAKKLEFRLKREGRIEGRVSYAGTGKPVRSGTISFQGIHPTEGWGEARVNWWGNYRLKNIAPGTYSLYFAYGPKGWTAIAKEPITVSEGETVNVDLTLIRSGFITGQVTDQDTNEPVANHLIKLNDAARPEDSSLINHHTITDETGAYHFDAAPGRALVHTNPPGGYQDIGQIERSNIGQIQRRVEVVEGETVVVDFQFSRGTKLVGRILTETGEPVVGADVLLMRWDPQQYSSYGTTVAVTDDDGWFREIEIELIVGDEYTISVELEGYRRAKTEQFTATAEMTQIADLILLPVGSRFFIEGRVTDTFGVPVRGARVLTEQGSGLWEALTDKNGDYRFEDLTMAVLIELNVSHPEYAYHQFKILKTNQRHDLVLVKADGYLTGKVVDTDGKPIERARVGVEIEEEPSSGYVYSGVRTNVQGGFELKHIKDPDCVDRCQ